MDLIRKFEKGEVKDKTCEILKILNLANKVEVLGNYVPENVQVCPDKPAFGTFNWTDNNYISTIQVDGVTILTRNANTTAATLVNLLSGAGYPSVVIALVSGSTYTIYMQSSTCMGHNVLINEGAESRPLSLILNGGCCNCAAPAPCLSDSQITKLIGEIQTICSDC